MKRTRSESSAYTAECSAHIYGKKQCIYTLYGVYINKHAVIYIYNIYIYIYALIHLFQYIQSKTNLGVDLRCTDFILLDGRYRLGIVL